MNREKEWEEEATPQQRYIPRKSTGNKQLDRVPSEGQNYSKRPEKDIHQSSKWKRAELWVTNLSCA